MYLGENLLIEVMPSGKKYFRVKKRNSTKALGEFSKIGLKEAQILASDVLDTMDSIRKEPSSGQVFVCLLNEFIESAEWADSTRRRHMIPIKQHIEPYFKNITLDRISRLYLVEFVKHVQEVACAETASKTLNLIKQVLDYAVLCGYIELNPS